MDSNLKFLEVNKALVALTGYSGKKLLGMRLPQLVAPTDRKNVVAFFKSLRVDHPAGAIELVLRKQHGGRRFVQLAPSAIFHDDGSLMQVLVIATDVTKRRGAEELLKQQSAFQETLLNKTSALLVVYDPQGIVRHISRAVEKMFGYSNMDVRGKSMWQLGVMDREEAARSKMRLRDLAAGAESIASVMRLRTKSGEERIMEIISTAVRKADGEVDCIIATGTDITERRRLQQDVLRATEAEQARIGHDLHDGVGQSLTGLVALAESLEQKLAGNLHTDAARIVAVLRDSVQSVRRLSHGMSPLAVRFQGLPEALHLLAETVRENFKTECTCDIDEKVGDASPDVQIHLYRIAQEAISNALRHGHAKTVNISLRQISDEQCELAIQDDGKGIIEKKRNRDGLGLRLMEYRAELIGGVLSVRSRPRQGVTVTCRVGCLRKQKTPETLTTLGKSSKNRPP